MMRSYCVLDVYDGYWQRVDDEYNVSDECNDDKNGDGDEIDNKSMYDLIISIYRKTNELQYLD